MAGNGDCETARHIGRDFDLDEEIVDGRLISIILPQELEKLLECPVCYEIILPPVVMCVSGHNICLDCRNQCLSCPICRGSFLPEARNHLMESIVDKCTLICRYHALGCNIIQCGDEMVKHLQQECEFRPVACRDCKRKIPFDSYLCHLSEYENIPKQHATECSTGFDIEEDDFSHDWSGQVWEPTWLHCFGMDFFCYLESSSLYWWIYVVGFAPDSVLEGFLYDVLVWNQSKTMESRFIGPVHSFRKSGNDIIHSGKCLKTTEQGVRAMMNQGGIDVVVRIFRTADYQPPKSRNTGRPIQSPISLRTSSGGIDSVLVEPTNNNQSMESVVIDHHHNSSRTRVLDDVVTLPINIEEENIILQRQLHPPLVDDVTLSQTFGPASQEAVQNNNLIQTSENPSNNNINSSYSRRRMRTPRGSRRQQTRL